MSLRCAHLPFCWICHEKALDYTTITIKFDESFQSLLSSSEYGPAREILALFVLHKSIFQTRMLSHPVGLDVRFLVGHFVYFHISCERTAKALA